MATGPPTEHADCPFCAKLADPAALAASNDLAAAFPDAFPLSPGHSLVVPRRHEADWFALSRDEQHAVMDLMAAMRSRLVGTHAPDGFNVGINVGAAAGQTVFHVHVHLVPRYGGDVEDPRGGVRHVVPDKARYWEE